MVFIRLIFVFVARVRSGQAWMNGKNRSLMEWTHYMVHFTHNVLFCMCRIYSIHLHASPVHPSTSAEEGGTPLDRVLSCRSGLVWSGQGANKVGCNRVFAHMSLYFGLSVLSAVESLFFFLFFLTFLLPFIFWHCDRFDVVFLVFLVCACICLRLSVVCLSSVGEPITQTCGLFLPTHTHAQK